MTEEARDTTPAVGTHGGPSSWRRAAEGAEVALTRSDFEDARWSFLYKQRDTEYAAAEPAPGEIAQANRTAREGQVAELHGPFIKPPVWTWEVPLYFWFGGVASGAGFVAAACDAAGDARSAAIARKVALGAVAPAPLLLVGDLGRSDRFLNMLRIFKPRSPMSMGAWCLFGYGTGAVAAVAADITGRPRTARAVGALTAVLGVYLGSYTGVLLACTAVPVWARSRLALGPIFVSTATATGAAATRLVLVARGLPAGHPTRAVLRGIETTAIVCELSMSAVNERRLGPLAEAIRRGRAGRSYRVAQAAVVAGLGAQLLSRRRGTRLQDLASVLYLAGGLAFRVAWIEAGRASAADDAAVAAMGRGWRSLSDDRPSRPRPRMSSKPRAPLPLPARRVWGEAVRRTSLGVERLLGGPRTGVS